MLYQLNTNILINKLMPVLREKEHYYHLNNNDIYVDIVNINNLYSCFQYIRRSKLLSVETICKEYKNHNIVEFKSCIYITDDEIKKILLSPIIEFNCGKYVIIDGVHRCYNCLFNEINSVYSIIIKTNVQLPSKPVLLSNVKISNNKVLRNTNFINYNPKNFRDINSISTNFDFSE